MAAIVFDVHRAIHKGLRKRSAELLIALGQADFSDADTRSRLIGEANRLLRLHARHDLHEEAFLHPLVARTSDEVAGRLDSEHSAHADAVSDAKRCMDALQHAPCRMVQEYGHELYLAFARVLAFNLQHMDYEERHVQPGLDATLDDPELREINLALLGQMPHEELFETLLAVLPAVNARDCAQIVDELRHALPAGIRSIFVPYFVQPMLARNQYSSLLLALDGRTDIQE